MKKKYAISSIILKVKWVSPFGVAGVTLLIGFFVGLMMFALTAVGHKFLENMGVFENIISSVSTNDSTLAADMREWLGFRKVMTIAGIAIGFIVVVVSLFSLVVASAYNVVSRFTNGVSTVMVKKVKLKKAKPRANPYHNDDYITNGHSVFSAPGTIKSNGDDTGESLPVLGGDDDYFDADVFEGSGKGKVGTSENGIVKTEIKTSRNFSRRSSKKKGKGRGRK